MFRIDGRLFGMLEEAANLVILNVLFLICCMPIFTIGAAKTALYDISEKIASKKEGYLVKGYLQSFVCNFRKSTAVWLLYLICMIVAAADIYMGFTFHMGVISAFIVFVAAAVIIAANMTLLYSLALQGLYENSVRNTIKNGFLLAAGHLPMTVIILTVEAVPVILFVFLTNYLVYIITFFVIIGFAVLAYINGKLFRHIL